MNTLHRLSILAALLLAAGAALASCQKRLVENPGSDEEVSARETTLILNGGIRRWDATKAEDSVPLDIVGSVLYISLNNGFKEIPLKAEFRDDYLWHLTFDAGALDGTTHGTARCYYFENVESGYGSSTVYLNKNSIVYQDEEATFQGDSEMIWLTIDLAPKTGRIRFMPAKDSYYEDARIHGLSYYSQFDAKTFSFTTRSNNSGIEAYQFINEYVADDSSYYMYVFFTDPLDPTLFYFDGYSNDKFYERTFDPETLSPGNSVVLRLPIPEQHNEWWAYDASTSFSFTTFRFVPRGTFTMGGGDFVPEHQVTISKSYYLSNREITRDQWYEVMGEPEEFNDSSQPVSGKTWEEIQAFITALNDLAEGRITFRLPTEAEWEWAARGSLKSYGFPYSGTNDPGAVLHNNDYLSTGSAVANELSLCDMSGNAGEFCADWFGPYSDEAQTDPTGPSTGTWRVIRGGDIRTPDENGITVYARATLETASLETTGFRLLMELPQPGEGSGPVEQPVNSGDTESIDDDPNGHDWGD